ncbi:dihydrofolate reductase family protein [Actinoplanes aureus]|uniref:Dihydrofolate reductase family protein n=1 Tax=Actinoplanes aureus TaxID=2792083 RepID=A0A931G3I3_9ACTN|nr:dihydrofolate reductase family protein [Actinoplanes aureus]
MQVHGSGRLIQALLRHHLVDDIRLLTFPVILGKGKRLSEPGTIPAARRLTGM